jgi:GNAT superfamily N-acetyltransferase
MIIIKEASNRLRREMDKTTSKVVDHMGNNSTRHAFDFKGETIGYVDVHKNKVTDSFVDEKYRGMGLGKKLYGEALRHGGKLSSDEYVSGGARSIWERMKLKDHYDVKQSKDATEYINKLDPDTGASGLRPITSSGSVFKAKFKQKNK